MSNSTYRRVAYAVWEITLRCNLACTHCGSRAGPARRNELTTIEALDVVDQLAELGITEVTLLGGEAFLRRDWSLIARAITDAGMHCSLTTGGWGVGASVAGKMRDAGIDVVSVSIDGLEDTHDRLRGRRGSWRHCFSAIQHLINAGIRVGCNTQINRLSAPEIPVLYEHLRDANVFAWQVQLTGPMGHAADNPEILLQPPELLDLFPMLGQVARRAWREGVQFRPSNNIGYYGPYERLLRSNGDPWGFWRGPVEGLDAIGIESDGSVKADPTLPSKSYIGGNVRDKPLRSILEESPQLTYNLGAGTPQGIEHLWGFCRKCQFATLCRGGDTFTAHSFFDRRGNHPYCHHRALVHQERGLRERLVLQQPASGLPYDNGVFGIVEEPLHSPWPSNDPLHFTADKINWPAGWLSDDTTPPGAERDGKSVRRSPPQTQNQEYLLPRSAWASTLVMVNEVLRAKRALDQIEAQSHHSELSNEVDNVS